MSEVVIQLLSEKEELRKEYAEKVYVRGVLRSCLKLLDDPANEGARNELEGNLSRLTKHFVDSGGSGSTAIVKLMANGFVDDFPEVSELPDNEEYPSEISVKRRGENKGEIKAIYPFLVSPPDDEGRETWKDPLGEDAPYVGRWKLNIDVPKAEKMVDSLLPEVQNLAKKIR